MTQPTNTTNIIRPNQSNTALVSNAGTMANLSHWMGDGVNPYHIDFENYYHGIHPMNGLSKLQQENPDLLRFWRVVNICRLIILEPIGYIATGIFKIEPSDERVKTWAEAWFNKRFKAAIPHLIQKSSIFATSYAYLWVDYEGNNKGLKLRVVPPLEGGKTRVRADYGTDDEHELTGCVLEYRQPSQTKGINTEYRMVLTDQTIQEFRQNSSTSGEAGWEKMTDEPVENPWRVLPVAVCRNGALGGSDLTDLMPLQDDLNTGEYDLRAARSFHGFPMLVSNDPIVGTVGPGKIISGTDIRRLETADLGQILAANTAILEKIAVIGRSVAVTQRGGSQQSGEAIKWLMNSLMTKCREKADALADCAENTLQIAARMMARDKTLYALEQPVDGDGKPVPQSAFETVMFTVTITPKTPADENASVVAAAQALGAGVYSQREALIRAGYSGKDAARITKERLEESATLQAGTIEISDQSDTET